LAKECRFGRGEASTQGGKSQHDQRRNEAPAGAGIIARMGSLHVVVRVAGLFLPLTIPFSSKAQTPASWSGVVRDGSGQAVAGATVELRTAGRAVPAFARTTSGKGEFAIAAIPPGRYQILVREDARTWRVPDPLDLLPGARPAVALELRTDGTAAIVAAGNAAPAEGRGQGSGGERLSSEEVSSLPLNERDFSKLLLLAAGTMTDSNGAANFTQQFSVNGQRGSATVFALDGADTTDPELGGATFANFNVDAIREVQSNSGVMSADIGHGAAGFTNVISKSGGEQLHGSAFEFVRNAAFDARNFFDHASELDPRRIPPFARNEFGVTNGRAGGAAGLVQRAREDLLLRAVSGIPPGARHDASAGRADGSGACRD
jgi:hypothetical protein